MAYLVIDILILFNLGFILFLSGINDLGKDILRKFIHVLPSYVIDLIAVGHALVIAEATVVAPFQHGDHAVEVFLDVAELKTF